MMKPSLSMLCRGILSLALLVSAAAFSAQTQIAQVPLLNITGTGTVKPNLMLLFDNSGSMDQSYTPDYVDDALCRGAATLADKAVSCAPGHPPYMSADFNKQYYNPAILYAVPLAADGTPYATQNATATTNFTKVSNDGFGVRYGALGATSFSTTASTINLTSDFPDLTWCVPSSSDCGANTATYIYPDATHTAASAVTGAPYYYNIGVAEYCTDANLTNCRASSPGAPAPANYPFPAKVRWCSDKALTVCQAKQVGLFKYPRFSTSTLSALSYGTIAIGASKGTGSLSITNASVIESPTTTVTLTSSNVVASGGTTTTANRQNAASALASSINSSATPRYLACVRTPSGVANVPTCASLGLVLSADNIVAVVAVNCTSSTKNVANCPTVLDASRAGWGLTVTTAPAAPKPSTALLTVSGTANNTSGLKTTIKLDSSTLATNVGIAAKSTAATAATAIVNAIGTGASVQAYLGGNAITDICKAASSTTVCLVNTAATANGQVPSASSGTGLNFAASNSAGFVDVIPIVTSPLSAGNTVPSTFVRVNLVSGATYPKGADRVDCVTVAGACSYQEEMTNFANWYVYYKTRLQMMKTSVGIAFAALNANYKVGFAKLSEAAVGTAMAQVPADFTGASRTTWYDKLYKTTTSGSTPSRPAVDNIGRMFANLAPYKYAVGKEVVQFPCQQNFMILTTDGYWNGSSVTNYSDNSADVANNDNAASPARFCSFEIGCVDTREQSQPSLADVALHWYNGGSSTSTVSLRPELEGDMRESGSVPAGPGENTHLHMNSYTLGLGVDGVMNYDPNYDTSARKLGGDFFNIITRVPTGCPWNNNGAFVWPDPDVTNTGNTVQERVDDLWHAAVNGHGKYFSASQPKEVVSGLSEALSNMQVRLGAAAAAATSTPNISLQDNDIFSDTFTTVKWYGELSAKKIDISTGEVSSAVRWLSSDTVGKDIGPTGPAARSIKMLDATGSLREVDYNTMSALEKSWFSNKCTALAQCTLLSTAERAIVNDGVNMVNWLRGAQTYANDKLFRAYTLTDHTPSGENGPIPILLGDIASSKPAYLRDSRKNYTLAGYADYKADTQTRAATVFTAANDGMLHAFDAEDGSERWAYMPRITMKKLHLQASTTYGTNHQFTTDGSPEIGDVQIGGVWKSVLVAGLNAGGRGYYAIDVTDPDNPVGLWELCADSSAACSRTDADLGLTFGNPQFGMWNNTWVVFLTSGYNNVPGVDGVSGGSGAGYLFIVDVATGTVLKKVPTGTGDATTPSGLAKITSISTDPNLDPLTTYIYGGDLNGAMWRFDLTDKTGASVPVLKMGDATALKPITTRPDVTLCAMTTTTTTGGVTSTATTAQRVVLFGTGRLLDVPDTANTDVQSLYLLKDSGAALNVRGATMVKQTLSQNGTGSNITFALSSNNVDLSQKDGWYFDWSLHPGERMNLDPQIVSGVANVVTNLPSSTSACSVGGTSNAYQVDVCTGSALPNTPAGIILSSDSAAVGFIIVRLQNGALKMIATLATGATKNANLSEGKSADAHRVGWRRVKGE